LATRTGSNGCKYWHILAVIEDPLSCMGVKPNGYWITFADSNTSTYNDMTKFYLQVIPSTVSQTMKRAAAFKFKSLDPNFCTTETYIW
jgi:hypothetical protein